MEEPVPPAVTAGSVPGVAETVTASKVYCVRMFPEISAACADPAIPKTAAANSAAPREPNRLLDMLLPFLLQKPRQTTRRRCGDTKTTLVGPGNTRRRKQSGDRA